MLCKMPKLRDQNLKLFSNNIVGSSITSISLQHHKYMKNSINGNNKTYNSYKIDCKLKKMNLTSQSDVVDG